MPSAHWLSDYASKVGGLCYEKAIDYTGAGNYSILVCGIVGYIGEREAQPILLNCLSKLEYRGYDSCGIAISGHSLDTCKAAVRVEALQQVSPPFHGSLGIGHTRWATHGLPTSINAHPHLDCSGKIAVVHNGIITNYQLLRQQLINEGHTFVSETDTEIIPHLIEKYYNGDLRKAAEIALSKLEGSYAVAILMANHNVLIVGRKESPLVIGIGDNEKLIASDVPAILEYASKVIYLEDGDLANISKDNVVITRNGQVVKREEYPVAWDKKDVGKGGYAHYMIKEIHDQLRVIRDSVKDFLVGDICEAQPPLLGSDLRDLLLLACGTSYHAGLIGKYIIEEFLGIPSRVELGSEFNHRSRIIIPSMTIAITQSGETADILTPLKKLKDARSRTLVITNVPNSTASRLADHTIYTQAGPEVSVAATKTFTAQLIELYKIALSSRRISHDLLNDLVVGLRKLPSNIQQVLDNERVIEDYAAFLAQFNTVFYVGRGINYPIALEGALKLKEIAYIHAEGYAAGELKHGPFALLDKSTPVVALATQGNVYSSMISTIKEIKARQSPVIALVDSDDEFMSTLVDMVIKVPQVPEMLSPVINVIPLQLLAYYAANIKGCAIDYPRNLAKSVTVE